MSVSILDRAKVRMVTTEPFFATLMLGMSIVETDTLPNGQPLWLAATDSVHLYFNPANMTGLSLEQVVGLLKHELLHVAWMHNYRVGSRDRKKSNQAQDYVINDTIIHEGGSLPEGGLHDPHNWNKDKAWEEIYSLMPQGEDPENGDGKGESEPGDGDGQGQGRPDDPFDGDVLPAPDQSQDAQQETLGRIVQAAQVAKAVGKLPAYMAAALGEILNPKVAWEQELAEFLTEVSRNDYSFARPNRRFIWQNLYLPSAYSEDSMGALALVFDTSGSVSMEEMQRFVSEAVGAIEGTLPLAVHLVYCDREVQHVDSFDAPTVDEVTASLHRYGCGGTDMTVALDHIDDNMDDVKACIVFTDGYTPFGHEREYPVLWAITSPGVQADMGRTLHVDL